MADSAFSNSSKGTTELSKRPVLLSALLVFVFPIAIVAQQPANIPIRKLSVAVATDSGVIATTSAIRVLPNGGVLHSDQAAHRIVLIGAEMKSVKLIADASATSPNNLGPVNGKLLPYLADSSVFVDASTQSLIVLDGNGKFVRVMAVPRPQDIAVLNGAQYGLTGFDNTGRLLYRANMPLVRSMPLPETPKDTTVTRSDSMPIVRANFDTRHIDTLGMVRILDQRFLYFRSPVDNAPRTALISNPVATLDAWAALPDGTLALIRGHDYHIDWIDADGTKRSTPKMPFEWTRITDAEKKQKVDQARAILDSMNARSLAAAAAANPNAATRPVSSMLTRGVMNPEELPDYYPPLTFGGGLRVDSEGNLWILPSHAVATNDGLMYDVVNRNGEIIERVQLPKGRILEGLGANGDVYMSVPRYVGYARLEKARIIR
ncbi:MAG: hypothetical protein ABJC26_07350 [Gemmatimonadaceae bacterium]